MREVRRGAKTATTDPRREKRNSAALLGKAQTQANDKTVKRCRAIEFKSLLKVLV